jgi:hypothetical protein
MPARQSRRGGNRFGKERLGVDGHHHDVLANCRAGA